jgi:hypothetical protein
MIFVKAGWADIVWEKIARATAAGNLGCSAKISPTQGLQEHETTLCCIYVGDSSRVAPRSSGSFSSWRPWA